MCKLERMPSKSFIFLQLFELKDDFIQAEIRKPSHQSTCSHSTGWFSKPMIKSLRLQLCIRFLSLCPNEDAKTLLRSSHQLLERSKKQEAICRSEQLKERKDKRLLNMLDLRIRWTLTTLIVKMLMTRKRKIKRNQMVMILQPWPRMFLISPYMSPTHLEKASPLDTLRRCCAAFH
uniref:Uncharacterized protein n=1 Tax=Aegilops tauschii subsp. strangulata TaxID=200361 RepID=A0A452ZT11_AEGTS